MPALGHEMKVFMVCRYAPFGDKTTTGGYFSFTYGHYLLDFPGFWVECLRSLLELYIILQFWGTPSLGPTMTDPDSIPDFVTGIPQILCKMVGFSLFSL